MFYQLIVAFNVMKVPVINYIITSTTLLHQAFHYYCHSFTGLTFFSFSTLIRKNKRKHHHYLQLCTFFRCIWCIQETSSCVNCYYRHNNIFEREHQYLWFALQAELFLELLLYNLNSHLINLTNQNREFNISVVQMYKIYIYTLYITIILRSDLSHCVMVVKMWICSIFSSSSFLSIATCK